MIKEKLTFEAPAGTLARIEATGHSADEVLNEALTLYFSQSVPNTKTLEAFAEGDEMLKNGTGQKFKKTSDLFAALEA